MQKKVVHKYLALVSIAGLGVSALFTRNQNRLSTIRTGNLKLDINDPRMQDKYYIKALRLAEAMSN